MHNQIAQNLSDEPFLDVVGTAALLKSTPQSIYVHLCNSGAQGGKTRKRFPRHLYVKLGRKVLFIKKNLVDWLLSGAQFEE